MQKHKQELFLKSKKITITSVAVNLALATIKLLTGYFGNSYALIADGVESLSDAVGSLIVFGGITVASKPPSERYPYGRGRAESLAGLFVAILLFFASFYIAYKSVCEITTSNTVPKAYTLIVLLGVILIKESMSYYTSKLAKETNSLALKGESLHHRSDVITSVAAAIGISIALIGGKGYENADDWAALVAAAVIAYNGYSLLMPAYRELIDLTPDLELTKNVRSVAESVPGVLGTHKCHIRKLGFDYFVDLDILCDPNSSIRTGHDISHLVGAKIHQEFSFITKILVHVEPADDFGRRGE